MSSSLFQSREPSASPPIDPQLLETHTAISGPSRAQAEQVTPITDGNSTFIATTSTELPKSDDSNKEPAATPAAAATTLPSLNTTLTMPGIGRLSSLHDDEGELDAGEASYYNFRRHLAIANDDYEDLYTNNVNYVRRVYNAITQTPATMDDEQTKMFNVFSKKIQAFGDVADQTIADISSMTVGSIYRLHSEGDYLYGPQMEALKPRKEDSTMKATERIDYICNLLLAYKAYAVDLMEGRDAITRFVAAPRGAFERKARNKGSNAQRAKKTQELRRLEASQGGAGEDEESEEDDRPQGPSKGKKAAEPSIKQRKNTSAVTAKETGNVEESQDAKNVQGGDAGQSFTAIKTSKPVLGKRRRRNG